MKSVAIVTVCLLFPIVCLLVLHLNNMDLLARANNRTEQALSMYKEMVAVNNKNMNTIKSLQEGLESANRTLERDIQTIRTCHQ